MKSKRNRKLKENILCVLVIVVALSSIITIILCAPIPSSIVSYEEYTVSLNENLWEIVEQNYDASTDVRRVIYDIENASKCSAVLDSGTKVLLPVYEK